MSPSWNCPGIDPKEIEQERHNMSRSADVFSLGTKTETTRRETNRMICYTQRETSGIRDETPEETNELRKTNILLSIILAV